MMTPGEIFLTVFVALLAGAVTYLGIAVRDLQRQVQRTYTPPPEQESGEREAHEALKKAGKLLADKGQALPPREEGHKTIRTDSGHVQATLQPEWPTHVEHPLADPTSTTQTIPVVKPNKHAL